jgi:mRNA interferase YafQ
MYKIQYTSRFKKELRLLEKRGYRLQRMGDVVNALASANPLDKKHRDHALSGSWAGYRECHIAPDWLLVYRIFDDVLVLSLARTGSHADLDLE